MRLALTTLTLLALAPLGTAGNDDFGSQLVPDFRGAPGSRFDGYDVMTQASFLPNFADLSGSCAGTALTQLAPGALITSTGNIYSFGTKLDFELELPAADVIAELWIQSRSEGNPIAPSSFMLEGLDANGNAVALAPAVIEPLSIVPGEDRVAWTAQQLAGIGLTDALVTFRASDSSCSLDVLLVDVRLEREPLEFDQPSISVSGGGTQTLQLDAGSNRAGDLYLVLGSATGTAPGLPLGSGVLPLVLDAYSDLTLSSANSGPFEGTFSTLDACGLGTARIGLAAGSPAELAGLRLWHAFVTVDSASLEVELVSNPVQLDLTP